MAVAGVKTSLKMEKLSDVEGRKGLLQDFGEFFIF